MNYYQILKISRTATHREIKNSYKQLVKKYHPDLFVGDKEFAEQKIKEINEAYRILSNPETKAEYDEYLNLSEQPQTYATYYSHSVSQNTHVTSSDVSNKQAPEWSFHKFIFEKFSTLDTKRQLQIFIFVLIIILSLFLINLIEVKYYLTNENLNVPQTSNTNKTENSPSNFTDNSLNDKNFYTENNIKTMDDLLYDLFEQYQQETSSEPHF